MKEFSVWVTGTGAWTPDTLGEWRTSKGGENVKWAVNQSESKQCEPQAGGVTKNKPKKTQQKHAIGWKVKPVCHMTDWSEKNVSSAQELVRIQSFWVIKKHQSALTLKVQGSEKVINSTPTGVPVPFSL